MSDVKKEKLKNNEFICKVCWKKREDLMFNIKAIDCDMGYWNGCGMGFSICDDCFNGMVSFIDIKAGEILENIVDSVNKYKCEDISNGISILRSIIDRRIADLSKLRGKLEEVKNDNRADSERSGGESE